MEPEYSETGRVLFRVFGITITWWKLVGFAAVGCFGLRWIVQLAASRKQKRSVLPLLFWLITLVGASLSLSYALFAQNDSVFVLQSLFPLMLALYNIFLECKRKPEATSDESSPQTP